MAAQSFRINKVAEMLGLSEGLLRAWERRYGIVKPQRTAGGFRVYGEDDVAVLREVIALLAKGMSIGDVVPLLPELRRAALRPPAQPEVAPSRIEDWTRRALAATEAVDLPALEATLDEVLAVLPPVAAAEQVLVPLQREVGLRWHAGTFDVAQEHATTYAVRTRLLRLLHAAPNAGARHVLCACLPDELHDVGLLSAALRFRASGFRVTWLGAQTPLPDLLAMVERVAPDTVALSATEAVPLADITAALRKVRKALPPHVRLLVGGSGMEPHPEAIARTGATLVLPGQWEQVFG